MNLWIVQSLKISKEFSLSEKLANWKPFRHLTAMVSKGKPSFRLPPALSKQDTCVALSESTSQEQGSSTFKTESMLTLA